MVYIYECDYCGAYVEYTDDNYEYVPGDLTKIYIKCPVCGKPIIMGVEKDENILLKLVIHE